MSMRNKKVKKYRYTELGMLFGMFIGSGIGVIFGLGVGAMLDKQHKKRRNL